MTVATEWRIGRGWSEQELRRHMASLRERALNFDTDPARLSVRDGWRYYESSGVVGRERPGPPEPDGPFVRLQPEIAGYRFSDPDIVEAHFDPRSELLGRNILLELKPLALRFLCAARVG